MPAWADCAAKKQSAPTGSGSSGNGKGVEPLRVGVVGCGQIAQIMHLPYLAELPQFRVTAICDLSPMVVEAVGERFGVPARFTSFTDVVGREDVDAVAVLTMEHAAVAVAATEASKHLFIEKPLGFSLGEADRIIDAVDRAGVTAMVAYMKRYDPGYEFGAARMQAMDDVRLIRVHDFAVDFELHATLFTLVSRDDLSPALLAERRTAITATLRDALGADHAHPQRLHAFAVS